MQTGVTIGASVPRFLGVRVRTARLAQVPGPSDPDAAEVGIEQADHAVADPLQLPLERAGNQERLAELRQLLPSRGPRRCRSPRARQLTPQPVENVSGNVVAAQDLVEVQLASPPRSGTHAAPRASPPPRVLPGVLKIEDAVSASPPVVSDPNRSRPADFRRPPPWARDGLPRCCIPHVAQGSWVRALRRCSADVKGRLMSNQGIGCPRTGAVAVGIVPGTQMRAADVERGPPPLRSAGAMAPTPAAPLACRRRADTPPATTSHRLW